MLPAVAASATGFVISRSLSSLSMNDLKRPLLPALSTGAAAIRESAAAICSMTLWSSADGMRLSRAVSQPVALPRESEAATDCRSGCPLQAPDHDVADALCLSAPIACWVKLPEAGEGQNHVFGIEL